MAVSCWNSWKLLEMTKWLEMSGNSWKWLEIARMAENSKKFAGNNRYGWKWREMAEHG